MLVSSSKQGSVPATTRYAATRRAIQTACVAGLVVTAIGTAGNEPAVAQDKKPVKSDTATIQFAPHTASSTNPFVILQNRVRKQGRAPKGAGDEVSAFKSIFDGITESQQNPKRKHSTKGTLGRLLQDDKTANELDKIVKQIAAIQRRLAEEAKAPTPIDDGTRTIRVRKGDSLSSIARRYLGTTNRVHELFVLNPKLDAKKLRTGQRIRIPTAPAVVPPATTVQVTDSRGALDLVRQLIELEGKERLLMLELERAKNGLGSAQEVETRLYVTVRTRKAVQDALAGERRATEIEIDGVARQMRNNPNDAQLRARLVRLEARLGLLRAHGSRKRRKG